MEALLIGLIVALTISRAMRKAKASNSHAYFVARSYRAKTAHAVHGSR